ncbi:MAG: lipoprotein-releasing ABC transporter permease subunit [Pseudomonadales bacterium]|nr:lipoprotein-releasing ABC transporter permease subunit [Pseudomonadales bacterium]
MKGKRQAGPRVPLLVGLRYARSRSGSHYLSFISRVSVFGLGLGVLALTVVVSVMNGFDSQLKERILGSVPHMVVEAQPDVDVAALALTIRGVAAATPYVQRQGLVIGRGDSTLVGIHGIDPAQSRTAVGGHMVLGQLADLTAGSNSVIMGRSLAFRSGLSAGDEFMLILPEPGASGSTVSPRVARLRVAGLFQLNSELDYQLIIMNVADLQQLANIESADIRLYLDDLFAVGDISAQLESGAGHPLSVTSWMSEYGDFFRTVKMEKTMMFVLLSMVIAIAAFNIVSGLGMMVREKSADIAILRTMGLSASQVMQVFLVQGAVIGCTGMLAGLATGLPVAFFVPEIVGALENLVGGRMLAGTYFSQVPTDVRAGDIVLILVTAFLITILASLYPAWRASRLLPAMILRSE